MMSTKGTGIHFEYHFYCEMSYLVVGVDDATVWSDHDGCLLAGPSGCRGYPSHSFLTSGHHELTVLGLDNHLNRLPVLIDHVGYLNLLTVDPEKE